MLRWLIYITTIILTISVSFRYFENCQPEAADKFLLRIDILEISDIAQKEQERLDKIKTLKVYDDDGQQVPIHYDQRQVLENHTVFLGATKEMVVLALGPPKGYLIANNFLRFVYYLSNDNRPTILEFSVLINKYNKKTEYRLTKAYKSSAIDVYNYDSCATDVQLCN